ncbi:hypothetical protein EV175_001700 [Coemansia sp. RSA 1933]|nr:hypothetical protein EV175_001700 [Coemansia sp. RSA 1933]
MLVAILIAEIIPLHLRTCITAYISVPNVINNCLGFAIGSGLLNKWHWIYGILTILAVVCSLLEIYSLFRLDKRARKILHEIEETEGITSGSARCLRDVAIEIDIPGLVLICGGFVAILEPLGHVVFQAVSALVVDWLGAVAALHVSDDPVA